MRDVRRVPVRGGERRGTGHVRGDDAVPLPRDEGEHLRERAELRELLGVDRRRAGDSLREHREDLDALDRVDAEVRLHVHLERERLDRVARELGDDLEQHGANVEGHRCGRRVAVRRAVGVGAVPGVARARRRDEGRDVLQRPESAELLGVHRRGAGHPLREHREDLDALDRVDPQVGLHPHLERQRLLRIAGRLRDHGEEERDDVDRLRRRRGGRRTLDPRPEERRPGLAPRGRRRPSRRASPRATPRTQAHRCRRPLRATLAGSGARRAALRGRV